MGCQVAKSLKVTVGGVVMTIAAVTAAQISPGEFVDLAITSAPTTLVGTSGARLGTAFATGDFDGDGELDLAVLAQSTTAVDTLPPFITIIHGCPEIAGLVDLASYGGIKSIIKAMPGDAGTRATLASGDFNGDNADDLALGIPNNTQATNYDGKVYVVFGGSTLAGVTVSLQNPTVSTSTLLPPVASAGWLGAEMATGDINNDGRDELLVSAPFHPPGGRVYVLNGQNSLPSTVQLETAPNVTRISETTTDQACGIGLDCADVDGDGFDDILVGSPGDGLLNARGTVSLIMGQPNLPSAILLSSTTPDVKRFYDEYEHGTLGWQVCLADVNGDGLRDPVMAAPVADPFGCEDCGAVYVVYWSSSLPDSIHMSTSSVPMTRLLASGYNERYGESMAAAQVNGDLCADIVMKREADAFIPMDRRSVVIAYGSASLPDTVYLGTDSTLARVAAEQPGDNLGVGLAIADLDLDGLGDVLMGAPWTIVTGRGRAGKVHVFYGADTVTAAPSVSRAVGLQVYPNPFSSTTTMEILAPIGQQGALSIFDVRGQRVLRVDDLSFDSGMAIFVWDGRNEKGNAVPSGVYFCQLDANGRRMAKKILLIR